MRYTAGYDRDFATQFFKRTLSSLAVSAQDSKAKILPLEVEYMANKLSETVVFSLNHNLGSPWYLGDFEELAQITKVCTDRRLLQLAEQAATQLLILEGVVARGGLVNIRGDSRRLKNNINRQVLAGHLFLNASKWQWHREQQKFVLRRMSMNVTSWVDLLSLVSGNDYLEMLGQRPSTIVSLPGD